MNNLEISEPEPEPKSEKSDQEIILFFLNNCGITTTSLENIEGIIPRENLLNDILYEKLKTDISKLKPY